MTDMSKGGWVLKLLDIVEPAIVCFGHTNATLSTAFSFLGVD